MDLEEVERRLDATAKLIDTGRWNEALSEARGLAGDPEGSCYARSWFLLALIEGLTGSEEHRAAARRKATECTDYTEELEGDLLRDDAIVYLKANRVYEARGCIEEARRLHDSDLNRMICLEMVAGRIDLRAGSYDRAYETLQSVARKWRGMGSAAHRQWQINLQLHLLMAAVMSGHRRVAWLLLPTLIRSDRNKRRWVAAIISLGGKRACLFALRQH